MKNILFAFWILATFPVISYAQNNSIGKSDPDAKKILDEVSNKMKSYKAIQATFTLQIQDTKDAIQGSKKGTLYVKDDKYRIIITGQDIFCDGKNIWTYDKASNEVTITKYDPTASTTSPQKLLTDFYDKAYLYKLNGEKEMAGKAMQEIEMTPIDKTKNFYKIYVYVDKIAKTIYSTKMFDKSGNKFTYTVNTFKGNAPISDVTFVFDKSKYPGVEVVDLGN
ncbi:MAG: outer membrane lipoprotein carrier protein LolA [Chitinophagales bacterium]